MTIEFQTAYGKVPEKLVNDIKNEILKLSHINKDISRAEVLLKEDKTIIPGENKVCEIKLTVYGDDFLSMSGQKILKNQQVGNDNKVVCS